MRKGVPVSGVLMLGLTLALTVPVSMCARAAASSRGGTSASEVGKKGEGALNILSWEGYTDRSFVRKFERNSGCKVNETFAGSSDEMVTKFRAGGGQYDLVSASGDASQRLIKARNVAQLDTSKLTHLKDLAPQLQSPSSTTVEGRSYGLSFMWGANVLIYNADKIKTPPTSWAALYDSSYKGKIIVPDNMIQIADVALQFFGATNPYAISRDTLDQVTRKLRDQAPLVRKYWWLAADFEELFRSGEAVIGAGWSLMTNNLREAGINAKEVIPKEGVTGRSDSWMVSRKAKHPVCAYRYMNYVTAPKVQAQVANLTGYSPANLKAAAVLGSAKAKALHVTDSDYYSSIKHWAVPVAPTSRQQWADAWAQTRGYQLS